MTKQSQKIRKFVISAVFLSIALVFKYFSFDIPLFGAGGVRIGFAPIFEAVPALLFGPLYGAVVSALTDVLGFLLKPVGAYMPLITLTAALGGFLRGFIWQRLKGVKSRATKVSITVLAVFALAFGLYNAYALNNDGITPSYYENNTSVPADSENLSRISALLLRGSETRNNPAATLTLYINTVTWGLAVFGVCAAALMAFDFIACRRKKQYLPVHIFITVLSAGLAVNTLNTIILRQFVFTSWQVFPLMAIWLPRASEELITCCLYAYAVTALYGIMQKQQADLLKK